MGGVNAVPQSRVLQELAKRPFIVMGNFKLSTSNIEKITDGKQELMWVTQHLACMINRLLLPLWLLMTNKQ